MVKGAIFRDSTRRRGVESGGAGEICAINLLFSAIASAIIMDGQAQAGGS
jgi:hypothetical protein